MSWDVTVEPEPIEIEIYEANVTYNVGRMIRRAGIHPKVIDGMKADLAVEVVGNAAAVMSENREYFKQFEAPNGWGTVESTLKMMTLLYHYLQKCPEDYVVRWR